MNMEIEEISPAQNKVVKNTKRNCKTRESIAKKKYDLSTQVYRNEN